MIRNFILAFIFMGLSVLIPKVVKAQQFSIGFRSGVAINHFKADQHLPLSAIKPATGYFFSLPAELKLNRFLFFSTGISLLQKNYSTIRTGYLSGLYQDNHNTYMQVPLMLGVENRFSKFKIALSAGVYSGYWLRANIKGQTLNVFDIDIQPDEQGQLQSYFRKTAYNEHYKFNNTKDERYELGLQSEVGLNYTLNKIDITLTGAYQNAITNQQKKYMISQPATRNNTFIVAIGIKTSF
ncbi:outer membrane beta-barrel protein [Mucilaginibacter celer]|uniref:PorT family protein n=1 Tax=Mucilaginibacter celer TaxID=2305508 RepID=A0A494VXN8_9SPHI|nr:outer membrane beta-barrel protein [Mucilaginibacter celer]AYL98871.1 PorT family protein [Mucilaginibacter celer]